jgi:AraC-like DNA-binding protein
MEKIEDFYNKKFGWLPDNLKKDLGHFNVFSLKPFSGKNAKPVPYKQRDYYKITVLEGKAEVYYADKSIQVQKQALAFSNPRIPYKWEGIENIMGGYFCIFNTEFFRQFGNLNDYSVFQPGGTHVFEVTEGQLEVINNHFKRMMEEISSNYIHKYDVLRTIVLELLHLAMKMQPSVAFEKQTGNASHRISTLFTELMERQFPIENTNQNVILRTASDFAKQLNVHVNYLNRAVKETTGKTTTEIISERILQEAKVLLRHSDLAVSEIAYSLGYSEPAHFNNFFKKHLHMSPVQFRKI